MQHLVTTSLRPPPTRPVLRDLDRECIFPACTLYSACIAALPTSTATQHTPVRMCHSRHARSPTHPSTLQPSSATHSFTPPLLTYTNVPTHQSGNPVTRSRPHPAARAHIHLTPSHIGTVAAYPSTLSLTPGPLPISTPESILQCDPRREKGTRPQVLTRRAGRSGQVSFLME